MAVVNTGATIFQANISKLRRPLDTVDLEELPDSREQAGAPVLWLSCEGQKDVWEMFSDNSFLSAILDRQGLQVAAPIDLRTKKAESFSPQLLQGFWHKLKKKNPKIVVMSPTVETKSFKKRKWYGKSVVYGRGRTSNSWRKTLPYFGTRIRKDLVVEKGAISPEKKYHCQWTLLRGE